MKLNLLRIWRDHRASLSAKEVLFYYVLPFAIAIALVSCRVLLNKEIVGVLTTALSIFCALLFGLLIPVIDQARRLKEKHLSEMLKDQKLPENVTAIGRIKLHARLSEQLFANVSFAILLSLVSVGLCVLFIFLENPKPGEDPIIPLAATHLSYIRNAISVSIFWTAITFVITVFMLLRRLYTSFIEETEHIR